MPNWLPRLFRVGLLYLLMFIILQKLFDSAQVADDVLNASRPSGDYVHAFSQGSRPFDLKEFLRAKAYYLTLTSGRFSTAAMQANLGFCEFYLGDQKAAAASYARAMQMDQGSYVYYFDLGILYRLKQQHEKAQEMFRRAIFLMPKTMEELVTMLHITPKYRDQRIFGVYTLQRLPLDRLRAYLYLVESLEHLKAYPQMLDYASVALKLFPDAPEFYFYTAKGALMTGHLKEAFALLGNNIKNFPAYAPAYGLRAEILKSLGDLPAAYIDLAVFKRLNDHGAWRRDDPIKDLHHWEENVLLFQIYH